MKRMILSVTAVGIVMILLISVIMAFVPDDDTAASQRYLSGKGFGFDYPREWRKASSSGVDCRAYSLRGFSADSFFKRGLLGSASLTVLISETKASDADTMTEWLSELYTSRGYAVREIGSASCGGRVYSKIAYDADGVSMNEYLLVYSGHTFAFVFASADESDISSLLSSVFFAYDFETEAV